MESTATLDKSALRRACYELAHDVLGAAFRDVVVDPEQCARVAESYLTDAMFHHEYLVDRGRDPNLLIAAVKFVHIHLAMPPLADHPRWFDHMLGVVIEIACPNTSGPPESVPFYNELKRGIDEMIEMANEPD